MERGKNYEYCATDASANRWSAIDQLSAIVGNYRQTRSGLTRQ